MTTPVGSIRVDMSIDGDDLWGSVAAQIAPVIAGLEGLEDRLNRIQRTYQRTGRDADRSNDRQVAGLAAATRAAGELADKYTQIGVRAVESAALAEAATDQVTRAFERQTRAINANTAARVANAGAPTGGPPSGGGGGGGGGNRGGRGGGGGIGSKLLSAPILNAAALGASALPAATLAVVNLVGAVQQLGQAGLAIPGIFAGIGASALTTVVGVKGVGDAIKALNEAAGDPKKLEAAQKALKDLDPAAVEVATSISKLTQGPLKDLQKATQGKLLGGVAAELDGFAAKAVPRFEQGMGKIATAQNGAIKELLRVGGSDSSLSFVDRIFGNTAEAQTRANKAIEPLVHGFGTLAATGSSFLPRLADGLTKLSTRFDNFITKADGDGRLAKWIDEGFKAAANFGTALLNIGKIITDITGAAGGDGGFLKWLADVTGKLRDFTSSEAGQAKLKKFFEEAKEKLDQLIPILGNAVKVIGDVVAGFQRWGDIILPVVGKVLEALSALGGEGGGALGAIVTGFLAFRTLSAFGPLLGEIGKVNSGLGGIAGKLSGLKKVGAIGGLALGIDGVTSAGADGLNGGNALSAAGGGALLGLSLGGPIGALIGALGGLTAAVIADQASREGKIKEKAEGVQKILDQPDTVLPVGIGNSVLPRTVADVQQQKRTALRDFNTDVNAYVDPITGQRTSNALPSNLQQQVDLGNDSAASKAARDALIQSGATNESDLKDRIGRAQATLDKVNQLPANATSVTGSGDLKINDPTPAVLQNVKALGLAIESLPNGSVIIKDNSDEISNNVDALKKLIANLPPGQQNVVVRFTDPNGNPIDPSQFKTPIRQAATPGGSIPVGGGGRAGGGVLPGYSPGVDNMLVPMSGGEGVLIPEAVRGIGGAAAVYAINSKFRAGLSRRGYAEGGIVDGIGTGPLPGPIPADDSEIGLLRQIRDLLAGKGGSGPLVDTAANTSTLATSGGAGGTTAGGKAAFDPVFGAKNGFLQALGFPQQLIDQWIGPAPGTTAAAGATGSAGIAGVGGTITANPAVMAGLVQFAKSGDTKALDGTGLGINDSVVTAITSARNKGKNGLDDDAIGGLVEQVLGGGFSGTLDSTNTALVKSLERFRTKGQKTAAGTGLGTGTVLPGAGVPGGIDEAILSRIPAGSYSNGPGDLTKGLADCSSAVEDLVNIIDGQPTAGRTVNTGNEADFLRSRGFLENTTGGVIPGALNIGLNGSHTQATLPGGTNFNYGSDAAAAAGGRSGDGAFGAYGPTQQFYRPVDGALPAVGAGLGAAGLASGGGALGYSGGGPVPVYIVGGPGGGAPGIPGLGGPGAPGVPGAAPTTGIGALDQVIGAGAGAAGAAGSDVAGQLISAILAATDTKIGTPTGPGTDFTGLAKERNPLAAASLFGLDVPDYTRTGGEGAVERDPNAPSFDAKGRMFSDTGTLIDRSFTDLAAQMKAQFDQTMAVFDQIKNRLGEEVLKPVVQSAVADGIKGLGDQFTASIGSSLGSTSAPIIASAVKSAIPTGAPGVNPGNGGGIGTAIAGFIPGVGMADGGTVLGGTAGRDSVPAMLMPGEHVFTTVDVARMGGQAGAYAFRRALARGQVAGFATGGDTIGNDTVGAEFFGVSQIPIIGAIVNLLVKVLLKLIGVEIKVRDTLDEMSDQVRSFRGDFQKFDATGRLMNDTSGLVDRSSTGEQQAADERIRILKLVIEGIVKFIIEKVIVPIGKAIANAVIQAGATAASGAIAGAGGGPAGGIVGTAITSLGSATVDIFADIFAEFSAALTPALIDLVSEGLTSFFPNIMQSIFGGKALEGLLSPILSVFTDGFGKVFGGLFGGLLGGLPFDQGGVATGVGLMPKATIQPERVLSPSNTRSFDQLPDRMDRLIGALEGGGRQLHVTQHVVGGNGQTPQQAADELLSLLGGN